jgi:hypothetical protein
MLMTNSEMVLSEIDLGLGSLCLLVDEAMARRDDDVFLVIDDLTRAILSNSNHRQAAGFCAFVVMRYQGYL